MIVKKMVVIDINGFVYEKAKEFYKTQNKVEFPSFKNFIEKVILEKISSKKVKENGSSQ